jgi:hypothetical protein
MSKNYGFEVEGSMPVDNAVMFSQVNLHQSPAARTSTAGAGIGLVSGAMGGAQQPLAGIVKKAVGLVVQLHGNVRTTVQVRVNPTLVTDCKRTAGLPAKFHIKGYGVATVTQIG